MIIYSSLAISKKIHVGHFSKHAQYLSSIGVRNQRETNHMQHKTFHEWFRLHVSIKGEVNLQSHKVFHFNNSIGTTG